MAPSEFIQRLREYKLLLPPLSGYTDYPYRSILAQFHPPFITTEMVSAQAVVLKNPKTMQMLKIAEGTHNNGVQLVGKDPVIMSEAAKILEKIGFDFIDINMGCTVKKITGKGAGVTLMKQEEHACAVVSAVVHAVDLPVTCKLRIGATVHCLNAVSLSQRLMQSGATALTIHGRSGEKKFGLPIDFTVIKEVVDSVSIPVVANGGIFTGDDAQKVIQQTGAAAVMPGRGLIGNPWLVSELLSVFSGSLYSPPTLQEKKSLCLEHLRNLLEFYGEQQGVLKMRRILPEYFSTCHYLKELKRDVQQAACAHEIPVLMQRIHEVDFHIVYDRRNLESFSVEKPVG